MTSSRHPRPRRHRRGRACRACPIVALTLALSTSAALAGGPRIIEDETPPAEPEPSEPATPEPTTPPPTTPPPETEPTPTPSRPVTVLGPSQREREFHRHDGVMFRILAMLDVWLATESTDLGEASAVSLGVPILTGGLELGYAFIDNLIVQAEVFFHGGPVLSAEVAGEANDDVEGSWWGGGVGGGLTYYVMPLNLYVAASGGIAGVSFSDDKRGRSGNTERGFYLSTRVGKEWWMTANWGLGAALRLMYVNVPDDSHTLHDIGIGFGLSATLN